MGQSGGVRCKYLAQNGAKAEIGEEVRGKHKSKAKVGKTS